MQECETSTGKSSSTKRVTVRSGGAGHAHSGVAKTKKLLQTGGSTGPKAAPNKIVRVGR
jgi:hypothetical protein